jgi:hypothetical protein
MQCYIFAFSQNALTLLRSVIAFIIYRFGHIGAVIASYTYFFELIDQLLLFFDSAHWILIIIDQNLVYFVNFNDSFAASLFRRIH